MSAKPFLLIPLLALLLAAMLGLGARDGAAQRFPRELENIRMYGQGESIEFVFSEPYEGTPVQEHAAGSFSLNFSGTGSTKPVRALRPVDQSVYQDIKVVQNRYSTTVTFRLKDPALRLKDRLGFQPKGKVLRVQVNLPKAEDAPAAASPGTAGTAPPAARQGEAAAPDLLREMEQRISGATGGGAAVAAAQGAEAGDAPLAFGGLSGGEFFYSLLSMVIALVIIIGALYGLLYLYNRYFAHRLRRFAGSHAIRQVASFHIGPRQRIVVVDINGELIACGVTPHQISYLTHLGGKGAIGRMGIPSPDPAGKGSAGSTGGGTASPGLPAGKAEARVDPVHQFAEVLKQKVRSLKRIN
jgi:flagellar protein FliO/FliZ